MGELQTAVDDRPRDPLAVMRSRWLICVVLAILGAVAGLGLSTRHHTQTTAEARLTVGSNSLKAYQVAGFATASEALAANYARFVGGSSTTTDTLLSALGSKAGALTSVDASPIPNSNVIRVEATATSPAVAKAAAEAIAQSLVKQVDNTAQPSTDDLLTSYQDLAVRVARQQNKVDRLTTASKQAQVKGQAVDDTELEMAQGHLAQLRLQQNAAGVAYQQTLTQPTVENSLKEIQSAAVTGNDRRRTQELYGVAGLLVGLLLGLVLANILGPKRPRRRRRFRSKKGVPPTEAAAGSDESASADDHVVEPSGTQVDEVRAGEIGEPARSTGAHEAQPRSRSTKT